MTADDERAMADGPEPAAAGSRPVAQSSSVADDRVLLLSKAVAVLVIPFLVVAFAILYLQPGTAATVFAWYVRPQLTGMLLAAAYLGGVVFFSLVIAARAWHRVGLGFPPVAVFASLLLITTLLHWGSFSLDRLAGWTWVLIYVVAPPLVVIAWWLNRRRDPGPRAGEVQLGRPLTSALPVLGLAALILAGLLYLVPDAFVPVWPWRITPLSARVLAPMICLPGILAIGIVTDRRTSASRPPLVAQATALVAMIGALVIRSDDLTGPVVSVALTWVILVGSLAGTVALLLAPGWWLRGDRERSGGLQRS